MSRALLKVHAFYLGLFGIYVLATEWISSSSQLVVHDPNEWRAWMPPQEGREQVRSKTSSGMTRDAVDQAISRRLTRSDDDSRVDRVSVEKRKRRQRRLENEQESLPECAQGLMVELFRNSRIGKQEGVLCRGILLRDDVVVADHSCVQQADSVLMLQPSETYLMEHDEDESTVQAYERAILSKHMGKTISFATIALPSVHHSSGWPRHRAFLQNNQERRGNQIQVACFDDLPVVQVSITHDIGLQNDGDENGIILQYPHHVDRVAAMHNSLEEKWWVVKQPREVLVARLQATRYLYEAPASDALDIFNAFGDEAIIEPEDPKFRIWDYLQDYYDLWHDEEPFSGEPFFEWVDFGSGRHQDPDGITRDKFNEKRGNVMKDEATRADAVVVFNMDEDNEKVILTYEECGKPVEGGTMLFVWGMDRKLYVAQDGGWFFHHICFLHAQPVLMAGEFVIGEYGELKSVSPSSGHYKPADEHYRRLYRFMASQLPEMTPDTIQWDKHEFSPIESPEEWRSMFFGRDERQGESRHQAHYTYKEK